MPQGISTATGASPGFRKILGHFLWAAIAVAAAFCLAAIALNRGEHINSTWLVLASACTYVLGFRFYAKFIAARVMALTALAHGASARPKSIRNLRTRVLPHWNQSENQPR